MSCTISLVMPQTVKTVVKYTVDETTLGYEATYSASQAPEAPEEGGEARAADSLDDPKSCTD